MVAALQSVSQVRKHDEHAQSALLRIRFGSKFGSEFARMTSANKTQRRTVREQSLQSLNELTALLELEPVAYRASNESIQSLFKEVCGKVDADQLRSLKSIREQWLENSVVFCLCSCLFLWPLRRSPPNFLCLIEGADFPLD